MSRLEVEKGTKVGIHANRVTMALFSDVRAAVQQGTPWPVVKLTQELTQLKAIKEISPQTVTMGRIPHGMDGMQDVGDISFADVGHWSDLVLAPLLEFDEHNPGWEEYVDVYEFINEADPAGEIGYLMLGHVMAACVRKARERWPAVTWAVGSFNMGTPEYGEMGAFMDGGVFEFDKVVLAVHEGVPEAGDPINKWHSSESDHEDAGLIPGAPGVPEHAGALFGRCVYWKQLLGERMPPVIVSEAYLHSYDDVLTLRQRVAWVDKVYSRLPYVVGFLPFTHSPTEDWRKQDYTPDYHELLVHADVVRDRENATSGEEEQQRTAPEVVKHTGHILPQDTTGAELALVTQALHETRSLFTYSHDAIEALMFHSTEEGRIVAWNPERWDMVLEERFAWLGVNYEERRFAELGAPGGSVVLGVPYLSQWGPNAGASRGDCGPACVAMIANYFGEATTVNQAAVASGQAPGSENASIAQLRQGLDHYGIRQEYRSHLTLADVRAHVDEGWPLILLVHYGAFPGRQDVNFEGGHSLVVVGYESDEHGTSAFLVNDPNFWGDRLEEGHQRRVSPDVLVTAMEQATLDGNWPRQGIAALGVVEEPAQETIDLLLYLKGDGRLYEVQHEGGGQERFQVQTSPPLDADVGRFFLVKNQQFEEFFFDDAFIWRGRDTSPGGAPEWAERPGAARWYVQAEPRLSEQPHRAKWAWRHMALGETYEGPGHQVQFFYKSDCAESAANSGPARNVVSLEAWYEQRTWNGITVKDVVELFTGTGERMWFARGFGLVAWESRWGKSAISEVHEEGARPDNERERGCWDEGVSG